MARGRKKSTSSASKGPASELSGGDVKQSLERLSIGMRKVISDRLAILEAVSEDFTKIREVARAKNEEAAAKSAELAGVAASGTNGSGGSLDNAAFNKLLQEAVSKVVAAQDAATVAVAAEEACVKDKVMPLLGDAGDFSKAVLQEVEGIQSGTLSLSDQIKDIKAAFGEVDTRTSNLALLTKQGASDSALLSKNRGVQSAIEKCEARANKVRKSERFTRVTNSVTKRILEMWKKEMESKLSREEIEDFIATQQDVVPNKVGFGLFTVVFGKPVWCKFTTAFAEEAATKVDQASSSPAAEQPSSGTAPEQAPASPAPAAEQAPASSAPADGQPSSATAAEQPSSATAAEQAPASSAPASQQTEPQAPSLNDDEVSNSESDTDDEQPAVNRNSKPVAPSDLPKTPNVTNIPVNTVETPDAPESQHSPTPPSTPGPAITTAKRRRDSANASAPTGHKRPRRSVTTRDIVLKAVLARSIVRHCYEIFRESYNKPLHKLSRDEIMFLCKVQSIEKSVLSDEFPALQDVAVIMRRFHRCVTEMVYAIEQQRANKTKTWYPLLQRYVQDASGFYEEYKAKLEADQVRIGEPDDLGKTLAPLAKEYITKDTIARAR